MALLFGITVFISLLYLSYPLWLLLLSPANEAKEVKAARIDKVSLILLSFNGKNYLANKIRYLLAELKNFKDFELIIIDDKSTDGSIELLRQFKQKSKIKVIVNEQHTGIPASMNLGVKEAKFEHIVFCDQRQDLTQNVISKIIDPLRFEMVGAVSCSISSLDKDHHISFIRKHENYLKRNESRAGNLMGVYGPLYAIKKECYKPIPDDTILDDLYLSLRILKSKQIRILQDYEVIDENMTMLYDYRRARRYLLGLLQILKDRTIYSELNLKQHIMLLWHKYLRLLIPVLALLCYVNLGLAIFNSWLYALAFGLITGGLFLALLPNRFQLQFRFKNIIRLNVFYLLAFFDILFNEIIPGLTRKSNTYPYSGTYTIKPLK
ncbi:MAG TPA: glycosyltransferase [Bacteroidales bacterium]|nr:glycosyltransferase [Bacteroidales bacterium]HRX97971.1 glycosyltransferase [Bacteroidales bacterium]